VTAAAEIQQKIVLLFDANLQSHSTYR